jgi:hypothetical protein
MEACGGVRSLDRTNGAVTLDLEVSPVCWEEFPRFFLGTVTWYLDVILVMILGRAFVPTIARINALLTGIMPPLCSGSIIPGSSKPV